MMDGFRCYGFPFLIWSEGGIAGIYRFSHVALWGNIAIAVLASALAAMFWKRVANDAN
jgi:hypothetical protein